MAKAKVVQTGMTEAMKRMWRRIAALGPDHMRAALDIIGSGTVDAYRKNIQQGRSAEGRFAPLSPRYAAWKDRRWGPGLPILVASTQLYQSLDHRIHAESRSRYRLEVGAFGTRSDGTKNATVAAAHIQGSAARVANAKKARVLREAAREERRDKDLRRRLNKKARTLERTGGLPRRNFAALPPSTIARLQSQAVRKILGGR